MTPTPFVTTRVSDSYDALAPDGSEIRLLAATERASMVHCTLPPGAVSRAVAHRTVEEIWHFIEGEGEVWRWRDGVEEVAPVRPGVSLTILTGARFQFRNTGAARLGFIITTIPPWPGPEEAYRVTDHWPVE